MSPFFKYVESAFCKEEISRVCNDVISGVFDEYFGEIKEKFNEEKVLPLIRVVPLLQGQISDIVSSSAVERNTYFSKIISNDTLLMFLKDAAGCNEASGAISKSVLFVCNDNRKESLIASNLTRLHGYFISYNHF